MGREFYDDVCQRLKAQMSHKVHLGHFCLKGNWPFQSVFYAEVEEIKMTAWNDGFAFRCSADFMSDL